MKFKWTGRSGVKDLDLVLAGIKDHDYILKTNDIIEIPDEQVRLINRIKLNGNYEEYIEPKKAKPTKKKEGDK